ncbi:MAG: hypothetical protein IK020_10220 [Clostridiales bacterium]|nr:hypothetical protein [Clostridiales bacterium]
MSSEREYWKGVPVELRILCDLESEYNKVPHQLVTPVLHYLYEHTHDYVVSASKVKLEDILRWIEVGFDKCLFPLKFHSDDWETNERYICEILEMAEEILLEENPDIFMESIVRPEAESREAFLNRFAQKLNAYFCIHYGACCQFDDLKNRMEMLFDDTKRNFTGLLNHKSHDVEWLHSLYQTDKSYEPLILLCYEKAPNYPFLEMLVLTYERYALFIEEMFDTLPEDRFYILDRIQSSVEWRLKTLCGTSRLYCQVGMIEMADSVEYWKDKMHMFEQIKEESLKRLEKRGS